ncbi:tyrosine-type recombinase/integrase [Chloroflexota bacterium]
MKDLCSPGAVSINDLESLLLDYRLCARTEGKSEETITLKTTAVGQLADFLRSQRLSTEVSQIGVQSLRKFILYLQERKAFSNTPSAKPKNKCLSAQTINDYMRSIRAFWSWLVREEYITSNPFSKLVIPKPPRLVIKPYSEEELNALIAVIDTGTAVGFRDWAIILTFLDTGTRVSELCTLQFEDTDLTQKLLKVRGKGSKERFLPIGLKTQRALWKYAERYRSVPAGPQFNNFFLTRDGTPLTRRHVGKLIKRYDEKAKLPGVNYYPHKFRHTFAINYLRNGGDVFSLQRILGHSDLDMVRRYLNWATVDIQTAHQRCSPVDHLSLKTKGKHGQKKRKHFL